MSALKLGLLLLIINMPHIIAFFQAEVHVLFSAGGYKDLFERRIADHKYKAQKLMKEEPVRKYKMLSVMIEKIFINIRHNRQILIDYKYSEEQGFPNTNPLQNAVRELLEMTCLLADLVLFNREPVISILDMIPDWRHTANWCIAFVEKFPYIADVMVDAAMKTFQVVVNYDERNPHNPTPNYLKPETTTTPKPKPKKPRKKLKKGPPSVWKDEF